MGTQAKKGQQLPVVCTGYRNGSNSEDGGCRSKQCAHCLADPTVCPHHCRGGHVLHHWSRILIFAGDYLNHIFIVMLFVSVAHAKACALRLQPV